MEKDTGKYNGNREEHTQNKNITIQLAQNYTSQKTTDKKHACERQETNDITARTCMQT